MFALTDDMKRVVLEQGLGFVATVCQDSTPNLSPKGYTTVWDDDQHLVIADLASPGTFQNLETNPNVEINVVDPFVRKGYRFKGTATLHRGDAIYDRALALFLERGYTASRDRVRAIALVTVNRAAPLVSPAYDGGATEASVRERWIDRYSALNAAAVNPDMPRDA
jgi:predicted pyridoxine 5'-phosphate oxidase superfamily flavin-nucleotide-binding protein